MSDKVRKVGNYSVGTWEDGRGHTFISFEIEGVSVSEGLHGLSDVSETISPEDAIALGKALRKVGIKVLEAG